MSEFISKKIIVLCLAFVSALTLIGQEFDDPQNMPVAPENTNCQSLPTTFEDGATAITSIKATRFHYEQDFKTTRRSGLMKASYSSCDFKYGFLIVTYDGKDTIYPEVPLELWERFRKTADIDGFYIKNIKDLSNIP